MVFIRVSALRISYTTANGDAPDEDFSFMLNVTGAGVPRTAYHDLKGSAPDLTWPQGSSFAPLPVSPGPQGNNLLTDSFGKQYGIRGWSITAAPGAVPGTLTVASYLSTNTDYSSPDDLQTYSLGPGGWDTGDLPVFPTDGTIYYGLPALRWVPTNLASLL